MAQAESHCTTANFLKNIFQCGNNKHIKTIMENLLRTFVKPMSKLTSTTNITPLATPTIPPSPSTKQEDTPLPHQQNKKTPPPPPNSSHTDTHPTHSICPTTTHNIYPKTATTCTQKTTRPQQERQT